MYRRTLLFLWGVAAAFGLACCDANANPTHGGAHPSPKSHPPAKNGGNANAKSFTHANKGDANAPANKSKDGSATKTTAGTQHHPAQKAGHEHNKAEWHKEKELHEREMLKEREHRAKLEAELDRAIHLLAEEHHRRYELKNKFDNGKKPYQQAQNGQAQANQQSQNGQMPSGQQSGGGASGDQGSGQPQVAQDQDSPGTETPKHGMASTAYQHAEKLLLAAIRQLEEAFATDDGHRRHHHLAEAQRLLEEAARSSEAAAIIARAYEHPRMDAAPKNSRS